MLSTILYVYLIGFAATETVTVTNVLLDEPSRVVTKEEEVALATVFSVAWPITVPVATYSYAKKKLDKIE